MMKMVIMWIARLLGRPARVSIAEEAWRLASQELKEDMSAMRAAARELRDVSHDQELLSQRMLEALKHNGERLNE